jgi:hypothetical protein
MHVSGLGARGPGVKAETVRAQIARRTCGKEARSFGSVIGGNRLARLREESLQRLELDRLDEMVMEAGFA